MQNLPLNSRDTYQLLQLQPGVQGVGGSDLFYGSDKPGAVSVNGGRGRLNNFSVNGGDGNDLFVNSPGIEPSPDAIQEFKVITNTFDAEYGRNSGAVINVVTKSGTNQFHGSIYDYVRNSIFDAKNYFSLVKGDDTQNQFGATIGGPHQEGQDVLFRILRGTPAGRRHPWGQNTRSHPGGAKRTVRRIRRYIEQLDGRKHPPFRAGCADAIGAEGGVAPTPGTPWASIFPTSIPTPCFDPVAANLVQTYVPLPNVNGLLLSVNSEPA